MYNVSLNCGVFSNEWKIAKVKPPYKKGAMYDIQNCRPISVLFIFSKLLERLMFNRWIHFFYLIIGYLQKLRTVLGKGNVLIQQFSHL
jgi:hypothetical protein